MLVQKNCARCGAAFECDETKSCWCFGESRIAEKEVLYDDCVCKNCLRLQYRKKLMNL